MTAGYWRKSAIWSTADPISQSTTAAWMKVYAFPEAGLTAVVGQSPLTPDAQARLDAAVRDGRYAAAATVDGLLLNHAGLHPAFTRTASLPVDVSDRARELSLRFAERFTSGHRDPLFDAAGPARGGQSAIGGIFWLDWHELVEASDENRIPQVVGHTQPRKYRPKAQQLAHGLCQATVTQPRLNETTKLTAYR